MHRNDEPSVPSVKIGQPTAGRRLDLVMNVQWSEGLVNSENGHSVSQANNMIRIK